MMKSRPPVRSLIRDAIQQLGGRATNWQIRDAILARYPDVNPGTINAQINTACVNQGSRVQWEREPRVANDQRYDFLFRSGRGEVEWYDPARHGIWEIVRDAEGSLRVAQTGEGSARDDGGDAPPYAGDDEADGLGEVAEQFLFSLERHLRDFLAANLSSLALVGAPLRLFTDETGRAGVEFPTGVGLVDVLAVDANGGLVVFELKLGRGPDAAVGQLARYMGWVRAHLAQGRPVRGVIVAKSVDEKLRYAASVIPDVSLFEYEMSFTLRPANTIAAHIAPP